MESIHAKRIEIGEPVMKPLAAMVRLDGSLEIEPRLATCQPAASQINGCAFCIDMHWKDARAQGETEEWLYALDAWRESPLYEEHERAALELCEAMTLIGDGHVPDPIWDRAAAPVRGEGADPPHVRDHLDQLVEPALDHGSPRAWVLQAGDGPPRRVGHDGRAIHTEGLTKRYGETLALDALDLAISEGEVYGYLGPERRGQDDHDPAAARPAPAERRARPSSSASTPGATRSRPTAASPTSPASRCCGLQLTAAETFEFLARLHGGADVAYRDQLVERFALDPVKKVRALSKGNRQKVQLIAALATRADLLILDEPTSGLDPLMEVAFRDTRARGQGARPDRLPLLAHPQRGRGALRPRRDPPRRQARRRGHAGRAAAPRARRRSRSTFDGTARRASARSTGVARSPAGANALRFEVAASIGPLIDALADAAGGLADEPRALARGDLPAPLRRGRAADGGG